MKTIHMLSQETINKIAAGEVVERPVSIVKELVENAIDAHATSITVEIQEGGLKSIRVTDNGKGISKEDIQSAFLRHATSKIQKATDLFSIGSLGFRGEALASIAAVSQVECISKTKESLTGIRYGLEGGKEVFYEEIGAPTGTTFIAAHLFYNVPARKKFLKSEKTEGSYVHEVLQRIALSHPEISFKFINNGQVKLHTQGKGKLLDCIHEVFGRDYAKHSQYLFYEENSIKIHGYVGEAVLSRGNRNYEIFFVNGRYIKSKWIQKGVEEGLKQSMMLHQFPFAVLFLDLPTHEVDVNVHPNKMDLRFKDEEGIYTLFKKATLSLFQKEAIPKVTLVQEQRKPLVLPSYVKDIPEPFETRRMETGEIKSIDNPKPVELKNTSIQSTPRFEGGLKGDNESLDLFLSQEKIKEHRIIGQVFKTYWLVEYKDELFMIDQHAAHEKVLFERWVEKLQENQVDSQHLLEPLVHDLNDRELDVFLRFREDFLEMGFEVELFGETSLVIKGVPYLLNGPLQAMDFIYLLDILCDQRKNLSKEEPYMEKLASIACKAAIKGNHRMSQLEYERLIHELLTLKDPYHCPHGRPTLIRMSRYEIEKKFKRS